MIYRGHYEVEMSSSWRLSLSVTLLPLPSWLVTFRYPDGAWKIFVSAVLEDASLQLENLFECEMLFPRTKFRLSRSTIYSPSKLNISNSLREVKYTFSLSRTTISLGQVEYLFKIIHQCNWRLHFDNDHLSEIQCMTSSLYRYQRTTIKAVIHYL